jgi:hypothetical protein
MTFRDEVVELRHSYVVTSDHEYYAGEETQGSTAG